MPTVSRSVFRPQDDQPQAFQTGSSMPALVPRAERRQRVRLEVWDGDA